MVARTVAPALLAASGEAVALDETAAAAPEPGSPGDASGTGGRAGYCPRRPQETVLFRIVSENLEDFFAYARDQYEKSLPRYVEKELRAYLLCGDFYAWRRVMRRPASRLRLRCGSTHQRARIIPGNV